MLVSEPFHFCFYYGLASYAYIKVLENLRRDSIIVFEVDVSIQLLILIGHPYWNDMW